MEARTGAGRAVEPDPAAHALDDALGDCEAEPGTSEPARGAGIGLLELAEDALLLAGRDADAGVGHLEADHPRRDCGLDGDRDRAALGELDGVAGEIEQ